MVDAEVPLHHKLLQVAIAKPKPEIPANAQDDDLGFEMPSFEHCWPDSSHARASLANRRRPICNTSSRTAPLDQSGPAASGSQDKRRSSVAAVNLHASCCDRLSGRSDQCP